MDVSGEIKYELLIFRGGMRQWRFNKKSIKLLITYKRIESIIPGQ